MAKWKVEDIDLTIERQIVTGLIVSDEFTKKIKQNLSLAFFKTDFCKIVSKWCLDYFNAYGKTPEKNIQDIFLLKLKI